MIRKNNILVSAASLAILLSSSQMYAMDGQQHDLQPQKKKSSYQIAKGIAKIIVGSGLLAGAAYTGYKNGYKTRLIFSFKEFIRSKCFFSCLALLYLGLKSLHGGIQDLEKN